MKLSDYTKEKLNERIEEVHCISSYQPPFDDGVITTVKYYHGFNTVPKILSWITLSLAYFLLQANKPAKGWQTHYFDSKTGNEINETEINNLRVANRLGQEGSNLEAEADEEKNIEKKVAVYEQALQKFRSAETTTVFTENKNSYQNDQATILEKIALVHWDEGWEAEKNGKTEKAKLAFERTKKHFVLASAYPNCHNSQQYLKLVDWKIAGNELSNKAYQQYYTISNLVHPSAHVFLKDGHASTREAYQRALEDYLKAKEVFEKGAKLDERFQHSLDYVQNTIENIQRIIEDLSVDQYRDSNKLSKSNDEIEPEQEKDQDLKMCIQII